MAERDAKYRPSKSQRKRDMLALQALGERLLDLSPEQVARLDLPRDLDEAMLFTTLKNKEAPPSHAIHRRDHAQISRPHPRALNAGPGAFSALENFISSKHGGCPA